MLFLLLAFFEGKTMNPNAPMPKMSLNDLKPKCVSLNETINSMNQKDDVSWNDIKNIVFVEYPTALQLPRILIKMLIDLKIDSRPEINNAQLTKMCQNLSVDAGQLNQRLVSLQDKLNKAIANHPKLDENSHMVLLSIQEDVFTWLENYDDTIAKTIDDIVNYVNSVLPDTDKINLNGAK